MQSKDKFLPAKAFNHMFNNTANKQRLKRFLKEEFEKLAQSKPAINFVYSLRQTCWNLPTGERREEFECHPIEADTIIFFICSQMRLTQDETKRFVSADFDQVFWYSALK